MTISFASASPLLDALNLRRIIKDIMRHQSREEKKRKKRPFSTETGLPEMHPEPELWTEDDIDPADFFDPEEFGFRRRGSNAPRT